LAEAKLIAEPLRASSICLRVLVAGTWINAEEVIRTLHTCELPLIPRFLDGICDGCPMWPTSGDSRR